MQEVGQSTLKRREIDSVMSLAAVQNLAGYLGAATELQVLQPCEPANPGQVVAAQLEASRAAQVQLCELRQHAHVLQLLRLQQRQLWMVKQQCLQSWEQPAVEFKAIGDWIREYNTKGLAGETPGR